MSLEKEFVPFELAVKLKELGFDEECFAFYARKHSGEFHLWTLIEWEFKDTQAYSLEESLPAPLWQQAYSFIYEISGGKINITIQGNDNYKALSEKLEQAIKNIRDL